MALDQRGWTAVVPDQSPRHILSSSPAVPPPWATHWQTVALQRPVSADAALSCDDILHAASFSLLADVPGCVVTVSSLTLLLPLHQARLVGVSPIGVFYPSMMI